MKVLVTGGAGYVGSVTISHLLKAGHEVVVLDDISHGHKDAVPTSVRLIVGNIKDIARLVTKADGFDAVIHCAGLIAAGESVVKPDIYWDGNVVGSLALLDMMRLVGIQKLIFSSSAATYGNPRQTAIIEDMETVPTSPYGMTKLVIDMAITSYCDAYGMSASSLRYFNVAGADGENGERHKVETHIIPLALAAAAGDGMFKLFGDDYPTKDGTCVRDYIHVADLARAHMLALEKLQPGKHSVYNLGNGNGFSNREVIDTVRHVTGKKLIIKTEKRRPGDPAVLIASSERARRELGWAPERPRLKDIISDAWQFYQKVNRVP
jgi:UDP-glucose 4-epimerase